MTDRDANFKKIEYNTATDIYHHLYYQHLIQVLIEINISVPGLHSQSELLQIKIRNVGKFCQVNVGSSCPD